jgi:hypothetical protein
MLVTVPSAVEAIFFAAPDESSAAKRAAYLDEVCDGDASLRRRIEHLLTAHSQVGAFL